MYVCCNPEKKRLQSHVVVGVVGVRLEKTHLKNGNELTARKAILTIGPASLSHLHKIYFIVLTIGCGKTHLGIHPFNCTNGWFCRRVTEQLPFLTLFTLHFCRRVPKKVSEVGVLNLSGVLSLNGLPSVEPS